MAVCISGDLTACRLMCLNMYTCFQFHFPLWHSRHSTYKSLVMLCRMNAYFVFLICLDMAEEKHCLSKLFDCCTCNRIVRTSIPNSAILVNWGNTFSNMRVHPHSSGCPLVRLICNFQCTCPRKTNFPVLDSMTTGNV